MSSRIISCALWGLSLATLVAYAPFAGATGPVSIVFSDTAADPAGAVRALERSPHWTGTPEATDLERPGVRVRPTEDGITVYVESFSVTGGTPTAGDNDFTRVDVVFQALPALGDGTTVQLTGTFDWTEPNALASWTSADFAVIPPPGVSDIVVRAASLGDAVIHGPGELPDPTIGYEGFLQLFGGTFQGWTIENLVVQGFDWPIGMYFSAGSSSVDFEDVTVRSNRIEMVVDTPGSSATGAGEPPQNIGLHSFGRNQTIQDNEFVIPGTGVNTGTEVASSVAIQCNAVRRQSSTTVCLITGNHDSRHEASRSAGARSGCTGSGRTLAGTARTSRSAEAIYSSTRIRATTRRRISSARSG